MRYRHAASLTIITLCLNSFFQPVLAAEPVPVKNIRHLFTIKGDDTRSLSLPSDVSVDNDGNIYIVDSGNHRISVFNKNGKHISYIAEKGVKQGQALNPLGIDVVANKIYLADKDNHRVQIFNKQGKYLNSISLFQGNKAIRPVDVAVNNGEKLIYVTGNNNHKVMVYDYSGKLKQQWGGEGTNRGELRYPATISIHRNTISVVDILNSRVQIFNNKGGLEVIAGGWGVLPGQLFRPKGVAHDAKGNIYISDSYLGVIQVFSNDTRFQYALGKKNKPYRFATPSGIFVDNNNRLYVCEMLGNKVSVFTLEP